MFGQDFQPTHLRLRRHGNAIVSSFVGQYLTDEINIDEIGHELFVLIDHYECRKLVISLAGVKLISSSMLGKLITLHRRLHRSDGLVVLCEITGDVAEILDNSNLLEYFNTADTMETALAWLESQS